MCAEDEPITLKEKACRSVCSRYQWVMIERGTRCLPWHKSRARSRNSETKHWKRTESEELQTVLELSELEIYQKKGGSDYHILKTMVKRSIEQNLRIKNFEARNGNYYTRRAVFWSCSFRHDINKRAKMTQLNPSPNFFMQQDEKTRSPRGRMSLWKNVSMAMQRLRQRNVHRLILISGTLQNTCSTRLKSGGRLGEKCSHAHRQFHEQPSEKSKRNYQ